MRKPRRPRTAWSSNRRVLAPAFTLVELLIVIGIIAVLISILVPALGKARDQARTAKCMANQRTLAQAVQGFAVEHQGFGQLLAGGTSWTDFGYQPRRYVYEWWFSMDEGPVKGGASRGGGGRGRATSEMLVVAPWPVAYASYLGARGLTMHDLTGFPVDTVDPEAIRKKNKIPVLTCPSDRIRLGHLLYPGNHPTSLSYRINDDIFGHD